MLPWEAQCSHGSALEYGGLVSLHIDHALLQWTTIDRNAFQVNSAQVSGGPTETETKRLHAQHEVELRREGPKYGTCSARRPRSRTVRVHAMP